MEAAEAQGHHPPPNATQESAWLAGEGGVQEKKRPKREGRQIPGRGGRQGARGHLSDISLDLLHFRFPETMESAPVV